MIRDYIIEKKLPLFWCAGCGNGIVFQSILRSMDKHQLTQNIKNFLLGERKMDLVGVCPAEALAELGESVEIRAHRGTGYSLEKKA